MENKNSLLRVARYFAKYRVLFALNMLFALGSTGFTISVPKLVQYVIDEIIVAKNADFLVYGLLAIVAAFFFRDFLNYLRIRINNLIEQRVLIDIRGRLHDKLMNLPVSFFDKQKTGDISNRVTEDVLNVERALLDGTEQGLTAFLTLAGVGIYMIVTNPILAAWTLSPIPFIVVMARYHYHARKPLWKAVRKSSGKMNALIVEDITGHSLVSSFALQDREKARFMAQAEDLKAKTLKGMYRWASYSSISRFISSLSLLAVLIIGGQQYMDEKLRIGELAMFIIFSGMILEPIRQLSGLAHLFSAAQPSGDRVFEILDHSIDIRNCEKPKPFPEAPVTVKYQNVRFSYETRSSVVENFDLELPAGQVTALVGHTGAGKSTLANLLLRFYEVSSGSLTINDTEVKDIDLNDLRSSIGLVSQDPFLFDGSIRENLQLAKENASDDEIWEALEAASIKDFVAGLPEALDTVIGERGIRLSMGEKQRLTIARVILKNPPLVILDEATSSVDTATEKKIQTALDNLTQDRTVLVIAHRLSTVRKAQQIVVLEKGAVIEKGTHDSLLKEKGEYYNFWQLQYDAFDQRPIN